MQSAFFISAYLTYYAILLNVTNIKKIDYSTHILIRLIPLIYIMIWSLFQYSTLTTYPFMHSDESWLSGLSRWMLESKSLGVTEPFFNTYQRAPHAIKSLFHGIQMVGISLLGYSLQVIRSISLLFAAGSLLLFFRILRSYGLSTTISFFGMLLISADNQFLYISHLGRQEIMLVFMLLLVLYLIRRFEKHELSTLSCFGLGMLTGSAFLLHPNGILVILAGLTLFSFSSWSTKRQIMIYGAGAFLIVGLALIASLIMNPHFLTSYAAYGKTLGVGESIISKILNYPNFYRKIYYQVSGTYYTPPVMIELMLLSLTYIISALLLIKKRVELPHIFSLLMASLVMHAGFIIIGRYGQPSVILFFPYGYLIMILLINRIRAQRWMRSALIALLFLILSTSTFTEVRLMIDQQSDYTEYTQHIAGNIGNEAKVLGNLNTDYALSAGQLYDWRNLEPAYREGYSFEQYVKENHIEYIIYPDEIDLIYERRPKWNGIYGNIALMYEEMQVFLSESCIEIGRGISPTYAMRIVRYQGDQDWGYRIYQVVSDQS